MSIDATADSFAEVSGQGAVLVDFWGSNCAPCMALQPAVDELVLRYAGRLRLVKVDSGNKANRPIAWQLKVMGLPTYVTMRDGVEAERLTGGDTTIEQIEAAVGRLLEGA